MALELQAHHPEYDEHAPDWELVSDCYAGQRAVKAKGDAYLPPTSGMRKAGMNAGQPGRDAYDAYKLRAVFPDFVSQAITGLCGVIHRKPPVVKVPPALEAMVKSMTLAGETLEQLWQRITATQLEHGHGGLLADVPDGGPVSEATPYVALYRAPTILNWKVGDRIGGRDATSLVVLDESSAEMGNDLTWETVAQIRVLARGAMADVVMGLGADEESPVGDGYSTATARPATGGKLALGEFREPAVGGVGLEKIPFVFFNTNDLTPTPCTPPLLGLANLSITVYLAEADYRHSLYMQSQDTLVLRGVAKDDRAAVATGAGAVIFVPDNGGAEFIGVQSSGLSEQRQALENDKAKAATFIIQLLDSGGGKTAESGEALRVRVSAQTATLNTMQLTAAAAIRDCLVHAAGWLSLPQEAIDGISVEPNLDFADGGADPAVIVSLTDSKLKGAPITWEDIHDWMRKHEITKFTFAEAKEKLAEEATDGGTGATDVDVDPTGGAGAKPVPGIAA